MEDVIEIVNPVGVPRTRQSKLAPRRYDSLRGQRVGLLDNNKPNADMFLQIIGELLKERYPGISLLQKCKMTRTEADVLTELIERCDVVINAFAD